MRRSEREIGFNKSVLMILMSMLLISCSYFEKDKGKIIINNESPYLVSDVRIKYTTSKRVDLVGDLPPNSSYSYVMLSNTQAMKIQSLLTILIRIREPILEVQCRMLLPTIKSDIHLI